MIYNKKNKKKMKSVCGVLSLLLVFSLTGAFSPLPGEIFGGAPVAELSAVKPLGDLEIGELVKDPSWEWRLALVSKPVTWIVVAKDHYGEGSGVTLLSEELIAIRTYDNSTHITEYGYNRWGTSGTDSTATTGLRPWLNSTGIHEGEGFYHALPKSFRERIVTVNLPNNEFGGNVTTADRVFIPSATELGDTGNEGAYEIGTVFPYFAGAEDAARQATLFFNDNNGEYWTRSPVPNNVYDMYRVVEGGSFGRGGYAYGTYFVRPVLNLAAATPVSAVSGDGGVYEILADAGDIESDDTTLTELQVDGLTVDGFSPQTLTYEIELPHGTEDVPVVTAVPAHAAAAVEITQAPELPGTATVKVTAEDGTTKRIYEITFTLPFPSQVKNTRHLPVVRSQGSIGSCAAFSVAYYYKTYQEARERNWVNPDPDINPERVASPAWSYSLTPRDPITGATSMLNVAKDIRDFGMATWEDMPYGFPYDYEAWPTEEIWKRAMQWRGSEVETFRYNTPEGLQKIKEQLADGDLVAISVPVYNNFDSYPQGEYIDNGVFYDNSSEHRHGVGGLPPGHAVTVVGYDDEREYYDDVAEEEKQGALLIVNSWGTNWGIAEPEVGSDVYLGTRGFMWIAYDYFLQGKHESHMGDTSAIIMTDRIDYQPEKFALLGINHTMGRQLFMTLSAGEFDDRDRHRPAMPNSNPYPLYEEEHGLIAVDLTDYQDYDSYVYYLSVNQMKELFSQYGGEGEISYFAVQDGDNPPFLVSDDLPLETDKGRDTEPGGYVYLRTGMFNESDITFDDLKLTHGGISWADFSGNGYPDLIATGYNYADGQQPAEELLFTGLFINNGDGTFAPPVEAGLPQLGKSVIAAADYNNSGYPDVAVSGLVDSYFTEYSGIFRNNGDNTFTKIDVELPPGIESLTWVDFDNDGRTDLAVHTDTQVLLYSNTGGDRFTPLAPIMDAAAYGEDGRLNLSLAWGDYDGDGLTDLAVMGEYYRGGSSGPVRKPLSAILKNRGDGTFEDTGAELPVLLGGSLAWGDYNKNGLPDLAVSGYYGNPGNLMDGLTAVFRNNGDDTFARIDAPLGRAWNGSVAWGDVNNNGWLDLVVTGQNEYMYDNNRRLPDGYLSPYMFGLYPEHIYPHQTKIFLNDKAGSFREAAAGLPRVSASHEYFPSYSQMNFNSTLTLVDYDKNGSLDFFLSGTKSILHEYLPEWIYTGIYRNDLAEILSRPNTSPEAPERLSAREGAGGGTVIFEWDAGSDAETPEDGLYYNIRVGTSPGAEDIISGTNAHITPGRVLIPGTEYRLTGIPTGTTLYWSIQTLDAGYRASEWSTEQSFTLEGVALSPGDVNGDGAVTVADAIIVLRHVVGLIDIEKEYGPEALTRAKISGNSNISVADAIIILRIIVGLT